MVSQSPFRLSPFLVAVAALMPVAWPSMTSGFTLPPSPGQMRSSATYSEMFTFVTSLPRAVGGLEVTVSELARSVEGRAIPMVHLRRRGVGNTVRFLVHAQQHGDEVSGKDALLFLVRDYLTSPAAFPPDLELWLVPMLNPDGAESGRRGNGAGVDLNRDHLLLSQPETRALHALARRVQPHVSIDCHEFARDSRDYAEKGWGEWPLITMDAANHPLLSTEVVTIGHRWVEAAAGAMARLGISYQRYLVGNAPPDGELRPSTLEADDARNSLALHGGLSFIIEAGVKRRAVDPNADLGERVSAYLHLLRWLLAADPQRRADLALVATMRARPLPTWLPTNTFWANVGIRVTAVPVVDHATGGTVQVESANVMHERIVKAASPTPWGYAVEAAVAPAFRLLLEAHGVSFAPVLSPRTALAASCRLVRLEEEYDEVYHRYEGRQVVRCADPKPRVLAPGSLLVGLAQPAARTAVAVLEPRMLYGLYQHPKFRSLVDGTGVVPVLPIVRPELPE